MTLDEAKVANDAVRSRWAELAGQHADTLVVREPLGFYRGEPIYDRATMLRLALEQARAAPFSVFGCPVVVDPAATGIRIGYPCPFCRTLTDAHPTCRTCGAPRREP